MKQRRILVTAALPYANGPIHIGHLVAAADAGTGDGEFGAPTGVAVDRFGNVYVAERAYSSNEPDRIQMFSSTGAFIAKWGEDGAESEGGFWNPVGVAADRSVRDPSDAFRKNSWRVSVPAVRSLDRQQRGWRRRARSRRGRR